MGLYMQPYYWDIDNSLEDTRIFVWCLNRQNEICLVKINKFPNTCYVRSNNLPKQLVELLDKNNVGYKVVTRYELYGYHDETTKFYLLSTTKHKEFNIVTSKLRKFGADIYEDKISPERKLLTHLNMKYCQWFTFDSKEIDASIKESFAAHEYDIKYTQIKPIPEDQSKWITNPLIMCFDIECYCHDDKKFPQSKNLEDCVYMISVITQNFNMKETRKKYCILYGECDDIDDAVVYKVKDETELYNKFEDLIRELNPVLITGYNICGFDYPYIDTRYKVFCYNKKRKWTVSLLDNECEFKDVSWSSRAIKEFDKRLLRMHGRISVDLYSVVKREHKLSKYDLSTVGKEFVGKTKHDIKPKHINKAFRKKDIPLTTKVAKYCIQDSELVIDIFDKLTLWITLVEMSNIMGVNIEDLYTKGQQVRCFSQLYDLAHKRNYVLTTNKGGNDYKGGFVFEPVSGLYKDIICLDFASLYPSITEAYNICYTTYLGNEPPEDVDYWEIEDENKEKHYFVKKDVKEGLVPWLCHYLVNERKRVRNMIKDEKDPIIANILDKRQLVLKVAANSIYGFLGVREGKLPFPEGAKCITSKGRQLILFCNEYLEKNYNAKIIYNDTDSTMFIIPGITGTKVLEHGSKIAEEISKQLPNPLRLEFEKSGIMFSICKKKYIFWMMNKDGSYDRKEDGRPKYLAKGNVLARRENCKWHKEFYANIIDMILEGSKINDVYCYIRDELIRLLKGEVDWENLLLIREMGSSYKADSFYMCRLQQTLTNIGVSISSGDRVEFLICKESNTERFINSVLSTETLKEFNSKTIENLAQYILSDAELYNKYMEAKNDEKLYLKFKEYLKTYEYKVLLGDKLVIKDVYRSQEIDYAYYIKLVKNSIDQIFEIMYKNDINQIIDEYNNKCYDCIVNELYDKMSRKKYVLRNDIDKYRTEGKTNKEIVQLLLESPPPGAKTAVHKVYKTYFGKFSLKKCITTKPVDNIYKIFNKNNNIEELLKKIY